MENGEPGAGRTLIFVVVVTGTEAVLAVGASATAPAWGAGVIDAGRCSPGLRSQSVPRPGK